jgi:hypothetical protein
VVEVVELGVKRLADTQGDVERARGVEHDPPDRV